MHIIQDFQKWKKVNEQETPPREREKGTHNNKVVAIPVDATTLKLKIVNDNDVLDSSGKLIPVEFTNIMTWLKNQKTVWDYYKAKLGDLTNNIVVYSVSTDNSRKQVLLFKVYSKAELKQQDPTKKGINPAVQYVRQDELTNALDGSILNSVSGSTQAQSTQQASSGNLTLPVKSENILNSTSAPLIKFMTDAYNKVKSQVANNKILPLVKSEVQASKLGKNSQVFVKALNAGYNILDAQFGEDIEKDITQSLADKLVKPEQLSVDEFNKITDSISTVNTGDIKVPADGFREGLQADPELKKFQDVLAKKLAQHLKDHGTYQAFVKAGRNGFLGNYGPLTHNLVVLLKSIAENPPYPNRDGAIIEPDFVQMIQAINESSYIGLDGFTLITESTFNFSNASAVSPSAPVQQVSSKKKNDSQNVGSKSSKEYAGSDIGKPEFTYKVEGGFWKYKNGSTWVKVMNPSSIKKLMEKHPKSESGGNYMIVPVTGYDKAWAESKAQFIYKKSGDKWQYSTPGPAGWNDVADTKSTEYLEKFYGSGASSSSSSTDKSGFTQFTGSLNADQIRGLKKVITDQLESEKATSNLSDSGVTADFDGVKWKFVRDNNTSDTYIISVDGSIKIDIADPKKTITGVLSSDLKKAKLSSGTIINAANLATLQTSSDIRKSDKSQTAESVADLAYMLKDAIEGGGTKLDEIKNVFTRIKTYPEWMEVTKKFKSITGDGSLADWLDGDLSHEDMMTYVLKPLKANGLIPMAVWNKYDNYDGSQETMEIYRDSFKYSYN
jgi:hypothetical protein